MNNEYFNWNDAWVFTALYKSHKNNEMLNLQILIGIGDGLNHAIFTEEEIITAFNKFQKKGIFSFENQLLKISNIGKEIIEKSEKVKGGLFSRVDISLKKLNSNRNKFTDSENIADLSNYIKAHFKESYDRYSKSVI